MLEPAKLAGGKALDRNEWPGGEDLSELLRSDSTESAAASAERATVHESSEWDPGVTRQTSVPSLRTRARFPRSGVASM
jgi:hypothetical protein